MLFRSRHISTSTRASRCKTPCLGVRLRRDGLGNCVLSPAKSAADQGITGRSAPWFPHFGDRTYLVPFHSSVYQRHYTYDIADTYRVSSFWHNFNYGTSMPAHISPTRILAIATTALSVQTGQPKPYQSEPDSHNGISPNRTATAVSVQTRQP